MDLYVERQCVEKMKEGDKRQFLLLFEANFDDLYKYVLRRVSDFEEATRITRLTFLDALGQISNTPSDTGYLVWLYCLAKPRVWDYIARTSFPQTQGLISVERSEETEVDDFFDKADKMMRKLSLEEREIMRLKFFEQVADGDVMVILGLSEAEVGTKIYRVLKRVHFLLFGEGGGDSQGVYFGEVTGLFEKLKDNEKIEIPGALRLELKADLDSRIDREDYAIDVEEVPAEIPVEEGKPTGSNDPAKIFVEAVREMREEEAAQSYKETKKLERREKIYDFIDKWKHFLIGAPAVIFVAIVSIVVLNISGFFGWIDRGYPTVCSIDVEFEGDFSDSETRGIVSGVNDKLCGHFDVNGLIVTRTEDGVIQVQVDVPDWLLEYKFVKKIKDWRIRKYERTLIYKARFGSQLAKPDCSPCSRRALA